MLCGPRNSHDINTPMKTFFLLLCMLVGGLVSAQEARPIAIEDLPARLQEAVNQGEIPGLALVLIQEGELRYLGGAGIADRESGRLADANTHFRIGSISKMLVAIAIMQQVERGQLSLDDRVVELLPELPIDNRWRDSDPVRVKHLLEHTAGFDDMHFRNMPAVPGLDALQTMQRFDDELRVRWRPGERMSYANPGYGVLGVLLQRVTGEPAETYISREVLAALQMHDTVWSSDGIEASLAKGYDGSSMTPEPWDVISMPVAGALVSTANDMSKLLQFWLSKGASAPGLISRASFDRIERAETALAARAGLAAGYGLANSLGERAGWPMRGHSGGITGYYANLLYQPEANFGFVLLVNSVSAPGIRPLQDDLVRLLAGNRAKPAAPAPEAAQPQHAGWYFAASARNELTAGVERWLNLVHLSREGDHYVINMPLSASTTTLIPLAGGSLRDAEHEFANAVFVRDADGSELLVWDGNSYKKGSFWSVALPLYGLLLVLVLLFSSLLFAPVWMVRGALGRLRGVLHPSDRLWPLLAALSLLVMFWLPSLLSLADLTAGKPTAVMIALAVSGWLFAALAVIGLVQSTRHWRAPGGRLIRYYNLITSLAAVLIGGWLWAVHLLGIRLWAW